MIHIALPGYNAPMRAIERRSYLRVNDESMLTWRTVTEDQVRRSTPEAILGLSERFRLRKELYRLEIDAHEMRRDISAKDRLLGSFLHNLNRRMELMTQSVINLEEDITPNVFDLSPAGIAYQSSTLLPSHQWLAVKLVFRHGSLGIASFARVCYQGLTEDDQYRVGIQLLSSDPTVEDLLTRHIASLQAHERRNRLHTR